MNIHSITGAGILFGTLAVFVSLSVSAHNDPPIVSDTHIDTHSDRIPRFCAPGTTTHTATASGNWTAAATWNSGVPGAEARVEIPEGTTVTYDANTATPIDCIEVRGTLQWITNQNTQLLLNDLQILPQGTLIVGTAANPIQSGSTAEIIIRNNPLKTGTVENPGIDPQQYGQGIIALGTMRTHGAARARGFIRLNREPQAGDTTLELFETPTGWQVGDAIMLADTRQLPIHDCCKKNLPPWNDKTLAANRREERTITAISGNTLSLNEPLVYDHPGAKDADGTPTRLPNGELLLAHIPNLTRNIIFRSEVPPPSDLRHPGLLEKLGITPENAEGTRGHIMLTARADVDIRYAAFVGLGRTKHHINNTTIDENGTITQIGTNQVGRYAIHFHHLVGPINPTNTGYQYRAIGNVIQQATSRWGITIHGSHYGLIQDNIIYQMAGSALITEDGNESFNVIEHNFAADIQSGHPHSGHERGGAKGRPNGNFGGEGGGFWFSGMNNFVRDNVATDIKFAAHNYNGYANENELAVPDFRGAESDQGKITTVTTLPFLEFTGNEAYGRMVMGMWNYNITGCCGKVSPQENVMKDFVMWHVQKGAQTGHSSKFIFDGWIMRGDLEVAQHNNTDFGYALKLGEVTYSNADFIIRNNDIQGFNVGIEPPNRAFNRSRPTIIENNTLKNYVNIEVGTGTESGDVRLTEIRGGSMEPIASAGMINYFQGGLPLPDEPTNLWAVADPKMLTSSIHRPQKSRVHVYNYNSTGQDFELFVVEQHPDFVIPPYGDPPDPTKGCPEPGLTNQQCFNQFGVAINGEPATCTDTTTGVIGLTCPLRAGELSLLDTPRAGILIVSKPVPGDTISATAVLIQYSFVQGTDTIASAQFQLDANEIVTDSDLDGALTLSGVSTGAHTLAGWLLNSQGQKVEGTDVSVAFTTTNVDSNSATPTPTPAPNTPPTITTTQDTYTITLGNTLTFTVTAQDQDGDSLTLDIPNLSSLLSGAIFE